MGAPQPTKSPILAAGRPATSTVALPFTIGLGGCGPAAGGIAQVCRSPTTAAGRPPIRTVATPGPVMVPGWPVGSRTRAAAGITSSWSAISVDLHEGSRDVADSRRLDGGGRGAV